MRDWFFTDFKNANVLYDIMKEIENKEHTIRHPSDGRLLVCVITF